MTASLASGFDGIPVLGIAAWSGTGKTTLLEALIPRLTGLGWQTAVIKHAHHAFDVDTPGKDSHRLREAGAAPMLVASGRRFALMMETPQQDEPHLPTLLAQVAALRPALILVEGFKAWPMPKLELCRGTREPMLASHDPWVRAVAVKPTQWDAARRATLPSRLVWLNLDDVDGIARWIIGWASGPKSES